MRALNGRGYVHWALDQYDAALADYDRVLEADSSDIEAVSGRADCFMAMDRHAEAIAEYTCAIGMEQDPTARAVHHCGRAVSFNLADQLEEALADYDEAIRLSPDNAHILLNRGHVLHGLERYEAALADFNALLDRAENQAERAQAFAGRADVLRAQERCEEALADYDRAIDEDPDNAVTEYWIPAEDLRELNDNIVGLIELAAEHH